MLNFGEKGGPLRLRSLNHISMMCRSVEDSISFYENVLGFIRVKRPGSFNFSGAWLFNYGIGIHLLQCASPQDAVQKEINPRDNHISFQCDDMQGVVKRLQEMKIKYVKRIVEEGDIYVDQLFIHDPDGFMVELCNCENLPVNPPIFMQKTASLVSVQQDIAKLRATHQEGKYNGEGLCKQDCNV